MTLGLNHPVGMEECAQESNILFHTVIRDLEIIIFVVGLRMSFGSDDPIGPKCTDGAGESVHGFMICVMHPLFPLLLPIAVRFLGLPQKQPLHVSVGGCANDKPRNV